jgi:ADP-heptose:LPS heptosyltransferase
VQIYHDAVNIALSRFIDRHLGVPICALLSAIDRLRPSRPPSEPPGRLLVILLSEMGCLVLAQPMFERLRARYPAASLHVTLFARNREALSLLRIVPEENIIAVDDRSFGRFVSSLLHALRAMRSLRPDVVIDCELFARVSSILAYLSGAVTRVGFHGYRQEGLYRGSFINRPVMYNPYQHISRQYLTLAAAIESRTMPLSKDADISGALGVPPFRFDPGELEQFATTLHEDLPAIRAARLVLVYPGGGLLPIRAWPLDSYRALCEALRDDGYAIGVIGLPDDRPLAEDLTARLANPRCVNLAGYTRSLRHLLALMHRASLLVTNDGGPAHFAALSPLPTIVLFGPETPLLYGTLAPRVHSFYRALPCSPCLSAFNHRNSPCDGDNQCLKRISVNEVLAKAREFLAARAPGVEDESPREVIRVSSI